MRRPRLNVTNWPNIPHIFLTLLTVACRSVFLCQALMMTHPARVTRDTATYRPYQKAHGKAGGKLRPKSLKVLSQEHLDRAIQAGQHSPVSTHTAFINLVHLYGIICGNALLVEACMQSNSGSTAVATFFLAWELSAPDVCVYLLLVSIFCGGKPS